MKLNKNFLTHKIDGEIILVPTGAADFKGLVRGNKSVEVILDCLKRDTNENEIIQTLSERFSGSIEDITADVHDVLSQLRKIGAIDE